MGHEKVDNKQVSRQKDVCKLFSRDIIWFSNLKTHAKEQKAYMYIDSSKGIIYYRKILPQNWKPAYLQNVQIWLALKQRRLFMPTAFSVVFHKL